MSTPDTEALIAAADALRGRARYRESISYFMKALRACSRTGNSMEEYYCLRSLGDLYRMTGHFERAMQMYESAVERAEGIGDSVMGADARIGRGLSLRALGVWPEALREIRAAKKVYREKRDLSGLAFAQWAEAGTLRIKGDIKGALRMFQEAHRLYRSLQDREGIGFALCGLGGASRVAGRAKRSLAFYTAANRVFAEIRDRFGQAYSLCGMANAYRMLRDYEKAFCFFSKATRLYRILGDTVSYAYTLWGIGTAHKMQSNYRKAREFFVRALNMFRRTKDPRGRIYCALGLEEIAVLASDAKGTKKRLLSLIEDLERYQFCLELCHARVMLALIERRDAMADDRRTPKRLSKAARAKLSTGSCYRQLGLRLSFRSLPMNIP